MKESIVKTTRPCRVCGRPQYCVRKEIVPAHVPLCGACILWHKLTVGWFMNNHEDVLEGNYLRILVHGAEREGQAHKLMMRKLGEITQFTAPYLAEHKAKPLSAQ